MLKEMHDLSARNKALQMQAPPKHGRIAIRIVMFSCGRVRVHVTRGDITSNCGSSLLSSARTIVLRVTAQFADEAATLAALGCGNPMGWRAATMFPARRLPLGRSALGVVRRVYPGIQRG